MRNRADKFAVLQDRGTAHALHDAACFFQKSGVCDAKRHILMLFIAASVNAADFNAVLLYAVSFQIRKDDSVSLMVSSLKT